MDFIREAISQNPHWESGIVEFPRVSDHLVSREAFPKLKKAASSKFIVLLRGLRRTGKSVLARQLMQELIAQGMEASEICWFEFDRSMGAGPDDINSLIHFFKNRGAKVIVFDEIPFAKGWQDTLKRHYDLSDLKFVATGSSALELDKHSVESLAGRFMALRVKPFSFGEYLLLRGIPLPKSEQEMAKAEEEMVLRADEYLRSGGLPEAILLNEAERKEYIMNAVLSPLFFKDLPAVFPSANPDMLLKSLELLSATCGSTFQFQSIAEVLGCSHPTAASQVELLERALIARQAFNYTGSVMKQKRTAKKIIIEDNGILAVLHPGVSSGALAENLVGRVAEANRFWRDSERREVDFVVPEKKLAIEVKYQEHTTSSDEKNLKYFLGRHAGWKGLLITKKEERDGEIRHIPLWKWLLQNEPSQANCLREACDRPAYGRQLEEEAKRVNKGIETEMQEIRKGKIKTKSIGEIKSKYKG